MRLFEQRPPDKISTNLTNQIVEVNNCFPTNYQCNRAVLYKGNTLVVILICSYFKTFKMPVVNLQRICLSGLRRYRIGTRQIDQKLFISFHGMVILRKSRIANCGCRTKKATSNNSAMRAEHFGLFNKSSLSLIKFIYNENVLQKTRECSLEAPRNAFNPLYWFPGFSLRNWEGKTLGTRLLEFTAKN